MSDRELLQQALEALRYGLHVGFNESSESQIKKAGKAFDLHSAAAQAIRTRLAEPEPEPVAWLTDVYGFAGWLTCRPGIMEVGATADAALMAEALREYIAKYPERFIHPPQQRRPLTDEQIEALTFQVTRAGGCLIEMARAVERAHGITNE